MQQLVLDIHYFLHVADYFVSEQTSLNANTICEKALRAYFSGNRGVGVALKSGEWYESRVCDLANSDFELFRELLEAGFDEQEEEEVQ